MRIFCLMFPLALLSTCAFALDPPDETPAREGEWGFRPFDGSLSAVDPPGFVWRPQADAASYSIQVAADGDFARIVHEATDLTLYCHCPSVSFGPGEYFWRFRFASKDGEQSPWSSVRSFRIDETSRKFPMPERDELLSRVPTSHPRLFVRPEGVQEFRELANGRLNDSWQGIVKRCEALLAKPPDVSEPPKYPYPDMRTKDPDGWAKIWWGNRERVVAALDSSATLAFAYMIGGEEKYAAEARRILLEAVKWDPKGATGYRYNDEAGMPFSYLASRTYTWIHDYLSEEDRQAVRACMAVRGKEMYDHLSGRRHIWMPYNSHSNRAWHKLGEVACAFMGEIPGAEDWAWFAMNIFFNSYPVWNDDEGGWHEGISYFTSYQGKVTWWLAHMKPIFGIDGYQKPFFAKAGDFPLYVVPPGETMGGFGDLTYGFTAQRCGSLISIFARMAGNGYWKWLAEQSKAADLPGGYMGFIYGSLPPVEAKAPIDLPSSKLFPGIGVAVFHNDLINRDNDVQFMMKSSPMGSQSHGYESQNAFLLSVKGDPVFIYTGRRDLYGSPHHSNWMWQTRSVNSILVDGQGQRSHSNARQGEITDFTTSPSFDYTVGEAAPAYDGRLDRFTRACLFIKPEALVLFDALEAPQPATFQWLLHSPREMQVDGQRIRARSEKDTSGAVAQIVLPKGLKISQTNQFDPPPGRGVKLTQWHLTAATTEPSAARDFVTVLRPLMKPEQDTPTIARAEATDTSLGCELELAEGKALVVWRKGGDEPVTFGGLSTDGDCACVVLDAAGKVQRVFTYGGSSVTLDGNPVTGG